MGEGGGCASPRCAEQQVPRGVPLSATVGSRRGCGLTLLPYHHFPTTLCCNTRKQQQGWLQHHASHQPNFLGLIGPRHTLDVGGATALTPAASHH